MAKQLVSDELWMLIAPYIPIRPRSKRNPGRKPVPDRACLTGILFVLMSGIPWEMLPQEMGWGSGITCWRRLHAWNKAGVWETVHRMLLDHLRSADELDFGRAVVDSATVRAVGGAKKPAPVLWIDENRAPSTMC